MLPSSVVNAVGLYYGIPRRDLLSHRRTARLATARLMAYYMMRKELGMSWNEIAYELRRNDHNTVMRGCRSFKKKLDSSDKLRLDYRKIMLQLETHHE